MPLPKIRRIGENILCLLGRRASKRMLLPKIRRKGEIIISFLGRRASKRILLPKYCCPNSAAQNLLK